MQTLFHLDIGDTAKILSICDNVLEQQLLEMGCTPGEKIELVRKAPFGGPVAILISSYIITIHKFSS